MQAFLRLSVPSAVYLFFLSLSTDKYAELHLNKVKQPGGQGQLTAQTVQTSFSLSAIWQADVYKSIFSHMLPSSALTFRDSCLALQTGLIFFVSALSGSGSQILIVCFEVHSKRNCPRATTQAGNQIYNPVKTNKRNRKDGSKRLDHPMWM